MYLIFLLGGDRAGGKGVCGRLMSPAHETQSIQEIRLLRGRLPRKGGGLTGMQICNFHRLHILHQHTHVHVFKKHCFEHYLQISNYNRNIPFIN